MDMPSGGCRASYVWDTGPFQCWLNCQLSPGRLERGYPEALWFRKGMQGRGRIFHCPTALQKDLE